MNKNRRIGLILGLLITVPALIAACPITIENDNPTAIWVISAPEVVNKLADATTSAKIKTVATVDNEISLDRFKRIKVGASATIGGPKDNNYYIFVKVPQTKDYLRLFQVTLTTCIPAEQKSTWWENNYLSMTQIKNNNLTPEQRKHLSVRDLRESMGYVFTAAYTQLLDKLKAYWQSFQQDDGDEEEASATPQVEETVVLDTGV
jgi:hypothetical protein